MTEEMPVRVLGVDACKRGWVGIELADGVFARCHLAATLPALFDAAPGVAAIGLDMPLGLLPSGWRQADDEARQMLGPLRSSVFRVPPGPVWQETEYAAGVARCQEINGVGFSSQTWGLRQKLLEANACWAAGKHPIAEVHPEVSFRAMSTPAPRHSKKSWTGQAERRAALLAVGIALPDELGEAGRAAPDDVLDAAAAAWSAHRISTGVAISLPDPPQVHTGVSPIAIWY